MSVLIGCGGDMRAEVYLIRGCPVGRLAIMPRPRAGDWLGDEIADWKWAGIDVVVSLLEDHEVAELGLGGEGDGCTAAGLTFLRFPIPDRGAPVSRRAIDELTRRLTAELNAGRGVGIHCRIGVGRAALVAACVLVACGQSAAAAWEAVEQARGRPVPDTPGQRDWVTAWAAGRMRNL